MQSPHPFRGAVLLYVRVFLLIVPLFLLELELLTERFFEMRALLKSEKKGHMLPYFQAPCPYPHRGPGRISLLRGWRPLVTCVSALRESGYLDLAIKFQLRGDLEGQVQL